MDENEWFRATPISGNLHLDLTKWIPNQCSLYVKPLLMVASICFYTMKIYDQCCGSLMLLYSIFKTVDVHLQSQEVYLSITKRRRSTTQGGKKKGIYQQKTQFQPPNQYTSVNINSAHLKKKVYVRKICCVCSIMFYISEQTAASFLSPFPKKFQRFRFGPGMVGSDCWASKKGPSLWLPLGPRAREKTLPWETV